MAKNVEKSTGASDQHMKGKSSKDLMEVQLDTKGSRQEERENVRCSQDERSSFSPHSKCGNAESVCAMQLGVVQDCVLEGGFEETEGQHQVDLEKLEAAIAKKRSQLKSQLDQDHVKEKAALMQKFEELEHARLTQQHEFRAKVLKKQENIEKLKKQYASGLENHNQELEEFRARERAKTQDIVDQINAIRAQRDELAPQIGQLEGKLSLLYMAGGDQDNSVPRGMLEDLQQKVRDTEKYSAAEVQQLEQFTNQQVDLLMDDINNLEQMFEEDKRQLAEIQEVHGTRLNDLHVVIQKNKRGPLQLDEEKIQIQEEVSELKQYWKELRGHIEEQIEEILENTEKKKFEGRDKLLKQRGQFFRERQKLALIFREATAKLYEKQREVDTARQLFIDRVKVKTAELDDMEDLHAERLRGRCERRDKRMRELEFVEQERAKRLKLESSLFDSKDEQLREAFNVKKAHVVGSIKDTEKRIKDVLKQLNKPNKKESDKIAEMTCKLAEIEQERMFLAEQMELIQEVSKKEMALMEQEGQTLRDKYGKTLKTKQKELIGLMEADEKLSHFLKEQTKANQEKFEKETGQLTKDTKSLEEYFDNLTKELERLKAQRLLLRDEYLAAQEGVRQTIASDEEDVEVQRAKIHEELERERESFNRALNAVTGQISEARRRRYDMTAKFKKDINMFTAKAMGMSRGGGTAPGGGSTRNNLLKAYEDEIQKYALRVHAINEKLGVLVQELENKKDEKSQEKLRELKELQKQNEDLQKGLIKKQKLVKEGNMLLQLFTNEDNCLYCRKTNSSKNQKNQLSKLQDENRKLTEKLTNIFKREKEYDRVSSKQLEELRVTLETSMNMGRREAPTRWRTLQHDIRSRSRSISQGSVTESTSMSMTDGR